MSSKIAISSLCLIACTIGCTKIFKGSSTVPVTIVNNSKEEIKELKITLCDNTETLSAISAGSSKDVSMKFSGECAYSAQVTFASGAHMDREQLGFVDSEPTYQDRFLVDAKSITFDRVIKN